VFDHPCLYSCPIETDKNRIISHSKSIISAIHLISANLKKCPNCAVYVTCPILDEFNIQVASAIHEITVDLNLAGEIFKNVR